MHLLILPVIFPLYTVYSLYLFPLFQQKVSFFFISLFFLFVIDLFSSYICTYCIEQYVLSYPLYSKKLSFTLILLDLQDIKDDYHNLLSILDMNDQVENKDTLKTNGDDNVSKLKERLSYHIAYISTSKFVEYWVPARISNVQLELYCAALLSNSGLLCSSFKSDLLDNIQDLLISTRKVNS